MRNRPGASSLAELLLVAWLFSVILAGVARFAHSQNRLAALQRDRLRVEEALRTGRLVLTGELRFLAAGDVSFATDSLRIRAFRGGGEVCRADGDATVHVVYRGMRQPEADKDSVLVVSRDTVVPVRLASWSHSDVCDGSRNSGRSARLTLEGPAAPDARYVLLFETGAYSLSGGAVRYRRGAGGRQPLTEVLFRDMALEPGPRSLTFRLGAHSDSLPRLAGRDWSFVAASLNGGIVP